MQSRSQLEAWLNWRAADGASRILCIRFLRSCEWRINCPEMNCIPYSGVLTSLTRSLGKPKGLERLVRKCLPIQGFSQDERVEVCLEEFHLTINPASHVGWHLYCFGTYEPMLRRLMSEYVQQGAICLEIGANIGWHTLLLSRLCGPSGSVHAFEPNPSVFHELQHHLENNRASNVRPWWTALSDRLGTALFMAPDAKSAHAGDGHLISSEEAFGGSTIQVEVETIDHVFGNLERLDFIKIDVEGWEPAVWRGAAATLRRHFPVICLEQLPWHLGRAGFSVLDASGLLSNLGYQFYAYDDRRRPKPLGERIASYSGDILALPPKMHLK